MPSPMSLGILSKLYLNGGSYSSPVWVEADLVSDLTCGTKWNEGESSVRRGRVQTFEPTNLAMEVSGKIRKNLSDAAFAILRIVFLDATIGDCLVLDGPITTNTSEGVRFPYRVFDFSEDQNLGDVVYKNFTLKPSGAAEVAGVPILPMSCVIAGGSPTYRVFGTGSVL